ncbi:DUF159-domain-containing protein [Pluteus cervinus]|uniref:DUF159-domain-containing protein n=1 Tax=Pluteus cervinus TaxID=181527 RepID=A0ACD3AWU7_9AGAR|nr:DUF159-domain-containing protein [Pluteus cervinus]
MCGRFALRLDRNAIRQNVDVDDWVDQDHFVPRYNIAPRTNAPVMRRRNGGPSSSGSSSDTSDSALVLHTMKWGLVPNWSKFEDKTLSTTNARSENLVEGGGMWGSIKGRKRCAVLCQGYYEWLTKGKEKLPHFTKPKDGGLMLMAGLYDSVILEGQTEPLWTFTIVTTDANKDFSWLHDRQPVILSTKEALNMWLDTTSQTWSTALTKLVQPYSDTLHPLECYQVPKEVGKVGVESPTFIESITQRKDGIQAMFAKQKSTQPPPTKRARDPSPVQEDSKPPKPTSQALSDDEIIILDGPPTPKKPKVVKSSLKLSSPPKSKTGKSSNGKGKITSFFTKA